MDNDLRCCGTGTCLINAEGRCWCGQVWNGAVMCRPTTDDGAALDAQTAAPKEAQGDDA